MSRGSVSTRSLYFYSGSSTVDRDSTAGHAATASRRNNNLAHQLNEFRRTRHTNIQAVRWSLNTTLVAKAISDSYRNPNTVTNRRSRSHSHSRVGPQTRSQTATLREQEKNGGASITMWPFEWREKQSRTREGPLNSDTTHPRLSTKTLIQSPWLFYVSWIKDHNARVAANRISAIEEEQIDIGDKSTYKTN